MMWTRAILLLLLITLINGFFIHVKPKTYSFGRYSNTNMRALKEGSSTKLEELRKEYEILKGMKLDDVKAERLRELKTIFDCVGALKEIEKDLALFAEHENGTDESLKKTAKTFTHEFLVCKEQIESQLNSFL